MRSLLSYFPVADPLAMMRRVDTRCSVGTPWLNLGPLPSLIPNPISNPSSSVCCPLSFSNRISRPNRHPDRHLALRTRSLYRESPHFSLQHLFNHQKRYSHANANAAMPPPPVPGSYPPHITPRGLPVHALLQWAKKPLQCFGSLTCGVNNSAWKFPKIL